MARPIRIQFEGACYHIMARGNAKRSVFRDETDNQRFLHALSQCCSRFGLEVYGYCLVRNHYHLLARTPLGNLSQAMGWLQTTYSIRFNRRHNRSGHVFQGRFKAVLVEEDAYARRLVKYVHLNPVRVKSWQLASLSSRRKELRRYPWSSHRCYLGKDEVPEWLSLDWLSYWGSTLPEARLRYERDMVEALQKGEENPWKSLRSGLFLGGDDMYEKVRWMMENKAGQEEIRWRECEDGRDTGRLLAGALLEGTDLRLRIWARVRLAGERMSDLAREFGYRDGSGVFRLVERVEEASETDEELRRQMDSLRKALDVSRIKS